MEPAQSVRLNIAKSINNGHWKQLELLKVNTDNHEVKLQVH